VYPGVFIHIHTAGALHKKLITVRCVYHTEIKHNHFVVFNRNDYLQANTVTLRKYTLVFHVYFQQVIALLLNTDMLFCPTFLVIYNTYVKL